MCSGCSGDYAGGFEFDDPEEIEAAAREAAAPSSARSGREADVHGGRERGSHGPQDAADSFEILVSGTRIIEIRVISANLPTNDQLRKMRALESQEPGKHSNAASAKYYPTRESGEKNPKWGAGCLRKARSLARACRSRFNGCLGEARRLARRRAAQAT